MAHSSTAVISADAIEHHDPFAGRDASTDTSTWKNSSLAPIQRPLSLVSGRRGVLQMVLTIVPLLVVDLLTIAGSLMVASFVMHFFGFGVRPSLMTQGLGVLVCYVAIGSLVGLYPGTAISPVLELRQLVRSCFISYSLVLLLNQLFATLSPNEWVIGLAACLLSAVTLPFSRSLSRFQLGKFDWWGERAIIIGAGSQGKAIHSFYQRSPNRGLKVVGIVDFPSSPMEISKESGDEKLPYLGSVRRVSHLAKRYNIRWGIVAPAGCDSISMNEVMKFSCDIKNLIVLPSQYLLPSLWSSSRECAGVLGVHVSDHLRSPLARSLKRLIDVLIASVLMIVVVPMIAFFALVIKARSPGPVFYGHERIGHNGKKFKVWKLRTMVTNADEVLDNHLESDPELRMQWIDDQKLKCDPRVIPGIGRFLRMTSLDEIPQFLNVLRGDMSLVGPRPIVTNEIDRYGDMYPMYLRVVPGITGLWQVSGRNNTSYEQRVRLDSYYVCNWSVWLDAYIVVRTVKTLLLREGAY